MNTQHLKYAVEIEKCGSISQAAEKLFMGQPTLSKTIKELEAQLGFELFVRTPTGVLPTPLGEEFLVHAKNILSQAAMIEAIPHSGQEQCLTVNIAAPRASYIADTFLEFLKTLDRTKKIRMNYKETNTMRALNKLSVGEYQIAIIRYQTEYEGYFSDYLRRHDFKIQPLLEYRALATMSEKHPLARKQRLTYADFGEYVELRHGDETVPYFADSDPLQTAERRIYIYERASQFEILSEMPDTFMWASPVPKSILKRYGLVQIECAAPKNDYKDVLVSLKHYQYTETESAFIGALKKTAERLGTHAEL